jgi:hypothetical protein
MSLQPGDPGWDAYLADLDARIKSGDPSQVTDEEWIGIIQANYPQLAHLTNDPEIRQLLLKAIQEGYSYEKLQAELIKTNYWQTHNAAMREWEADKAIDPATAQRTLERKAVAIQSLARSRGFNIPHATATAMAEDALSFGMTDDEIMFKLSVWFKEGKFAVGEDAFATNKVALRALAQSYLISVSDSQLASLAGDIAMGNTTMDAVRLNWMDKAKGAYPWLADDIDAGLSVDQYYGPLTNTVASLLEMAPEAINLTDPRWGAILRSADGDRAPTITEVAQWARSQPEWKNTENGRRSAAQGGTQILEAFGAVKI